MTLAGTRPPLISETNLYEPRHKVRLAIKPGITGMWQVSGRSDITDFEEVVRLDKEYIENWNIGLDIKILLKTVMVVVKGIQLMWCILLILLPIALLFAESSMNNLQSVSIVAAFPIGAVIVMIAVSFMKDAKKYMENLEKSAKEKGEN